MAMLNAFKHSNNTCTPGTMYVIVVEAHSALSRAHSHRMCVQLDTHTHSQKTQNLLLFLPLHAGPTNASRARMRP